LRLLIVKLCSLGDSVLISPTLRALRKKYPADHITLLTSEPYVDIFRGSQHVDELKVAPAMNTHWSGGRTIHYYDAIVSRELQDRHYDKLIELNTTIFMGEYRRTGVHMRDHYAEMAGVYPLEDTSYDVPLMGDERNIFWSIFPEEDPTTTCPVVLHTGGGWALKFLPMHQWLPILKHLNHVLPANTPVYFIGGSEDTLIPEFAQDVKRILGDRKFVDMAGKLPLKVLYWLCQRSSLFVGGDSGPMHLASAANCPSVVYFTVTSQYVGTPTSSRFVTMQSMDSCSVPCGLVQCGTRTLCAKTTDPQHVNLAIDRLLSAGSDSIQEHYKGDKPTHHYFYQWNHYSLPNPEPSLSQWLDNRKALDPSWIPNL